MGREGGIARGGGVQEGGRGGTYILYRAPPSPPPRAPKEGSLDPQPPPPGARGGRSQTTTAHGRACDEGEVRGGERHVGDAIIGQGPPRHRVCGVQRPPPPMPLGMKRTVGAEHFPIPNGRQPRKRPQGPGHGAAMGGGGGAAQARGPGPSHAHTPTTSYPQKRERGGGTCGTFRHGPRLRRAPAQRPHAPQPQSHVCDTRATLLGGGGGTHTHTHDPSTAGAPRAMRIHRDHLRTRSAAKR